MGKSGDETTTYVYGTALSDSGIATSTLKWAEIYPESDELASPLGEWTRWRLRPHRVPAD